MVSAESLELQLGELRITPGEAHGERVRERCDPRYRFHTAACALDRTVERGREVCVCPSDFVEAQVYFRTIADQAAHVRWWYRCTTTQVPDVQRGAGTYAPVPGYNLF